MLVLVCLVLFLPGFFSLPPIDRDEVLFAQASKQMVESGDFIDIRVGERPRYKKPAGIYWLQATAYAIAGEAHRHDIWVFRLPSLIAATGAVLLTYLFGLAIAGRRAGMIAGLLMASAFLPGAEARLAKTDATLLLTIIAAQYALGRVFLRGAAGGGASAGTVALFWAALGAGVLIKGPVGPVVTGLTILALLALTREARWLKPLLRPWGLLLFLAIALPWYVLIHLEAGEAFWRESLGRDMAAKITSAQESHGAPPGSYLAAFWITFFPGSLFLLPVLGRLWRMRRERAVMFLIAWILPTWAMFELMPTKLVHYVLPTYPAIALLIALGFVRRAAPSESASSALPASPPAPAQASTPAHPLPHSPPPTSTSAPLPLPVPSPGRLTRALMILLLLIPFALLGAIAAEAPKYAAGAGESRAVPLTLWLGFALLLPLAGLAAVLIWRGRLVQALLTAPALSLALSIGLYPTLARLPGLWPAKAAAEIVNAYAICARPSLATFGYDEASLMFLTDSRLKRAPGAEGIDPACAVIVVEKQAGAAWEKVRAALGTDFREIGQAEGLNLATGRPVRLTILASP